MNPSDAQRSRLEELERRIHALEKRVNERHAEAREEAAALRRELFALRHEVPEQGTSTPSQPDESPALVGSTTSPPPPVEPISAEVVEIPQTSAAPGASATPPGSWLPTSTEGLEALIGGRWLTWAGSLVLLVAVGFGVHWAWTTFETPDWLQVTALHGIALAVVGSAFVLRLRRLPILSQAVAGIGIFALYSIALASLHLYEMWPATVGMAEFTAITALAIVVALWFDSPVVVIVGALGGYLNPILTSDGSGDHVLLFTYFAFLNVTLMACAVWRGWNFLKPIGLVATALMFLLWLASDYDPAIHRWSTEWLVALHAGIFLLGTTLPPLLWRRASTASDLFTLSANAFWFLGMTRYLFHDVPGQQLALVCWCLALGHLALYALTHLRLASTDRMPRVQLALCAAFFVLAAPLQLDEAMYLGPAWCAEGVVFLVIGAYFRDLQMRVSGMIVFALAAVKLLVDFAEPASMIAGTSLDVRFVTVFSGSLIMFAAGGLYLALQERIGESIRAWEFPGFPAALMVVGNTLAMLSLTCQWDGRIVLVMWTLDAAAIWALGFSINRAGARWYGCLLMVVLVGLRILYHGDQVTEPFRLLLNDRLATLALVSVVYFVAAWAYHRRAIGSDEASKLPIHPMLQERSIDPIFAFLGNLILIVALSLELRDWFDAEASAIGQQWNNLRMARLAGYSILWAIYAAILVAVGFILPYRWFRLIGLIAFGPILLKVFFVDLAELELFPRVLAFGVLGIMLLAVSWLYQQFSARLTTE